MALQLKHPDDITLWEAWKVFDREARCGIYADMQRYDNCREAKMDLIFDEYIAAYQDLLNDYCEELQEGGI